MNKKTIALLLAAFAATALTAPAQTATSTAPASSWVVTGSVASQYMFRGVRLGGVSFQPSVEYDAGQLALGVWANVPITKKVVGQSDPEFDFYGTYSLDPINDMLTLVPGFTVYTYPDAKKSNGFYKITAEPNIALNINLNGLKLTPKLYYDVVLKGGTAELGAAYAVPLKDAGTEIDFSAVAGTYAWSAAVANSTPDIKNYGDYWQIGASMPFQVEKDAKLTIGWSFVKGANNYFKASGAGRATNTAAVGRGVVTISYAVTF